MGKWKDVYKRQAIFQVASIITTTGFVTADYNLWPELSKCLLLMVMIVGARCV